MDAGNQKPKGFCTVPGSVNQSAANWKARPAGFGTQQDVAAVKPSPLKFSNCILN